MPKFTVHICRTWEERFSVEVEAASLEEAKAKGLEEGDDEEFNWNNVERCDDEIMFVDDEDGNTLFDRNEDTE